jgi:hypothetical protein
MEMVGKALRAMARCSAVILALGAGMAPAAANAKDLAAPLNYLVGEWTGDGWIDMGQGRMGFRQHERIISRLDNNIITIEGTGRDPVNEQEIVFEAFAVLSASGKPGEFAMRSYTRDGQVGTFPAVLEAPGRMVWTIPVQGRTIRYRSEVVGDRWIEVGEASVDGGASWTKFFEMTLSRMPAR